MSIRSIVAALAVTIAAAFPAHAEEDVRIRGTIPHNLAQGETDAQLASRIAQLVGALDQRIAPPCGMARTFEIISAEHFGFDDMRTQTEPNTPGLWRIAVYGKGCWATRLHNVFLFPRGATPASLRLGVPGRTVAAVKYQQSATQLVLRQANGIAMRLNCKAPAFLADSEQATPYVKGKAWNETWSATACSVTRKFTVMFTPEANGQMRVAAILAD